MRKAVISLSLLLCLLPFRSSAQLYSLGADPGRVKWSQVRTDGYRVVYPEGMDSLARVYARLLESSRSAVSTTIGYRPNGAYRKPMPVVLHPFVANFNGTVSWAPRRMELFTVPDADSPLPMRSEEQLVLHESRHVAQMQFGAQKPYRWLNVLTGELWPGAMAALYPGQTFFEGDAVVAETELSLSGRGRTSSFLNYYDICFAEGDFRDYWTWKTSSQRYYTPDQYRAGYFLIGGIRTFYDDPDFTARYYRNVTSGKWPFPFFVLQKTVREASGKGLKETFRELAQKQADAWEEESQARKPFMPMTRLTAPGRIYSSLAELENDGTSLLSIRSGLDRTPELVRISRDGKFSRIRPMAATASKFTYSDSLGRLYWHETVRDHRWELRSSSLIRYTDGSGRARTLAGKGHKYYNPSVDGNQIAVAEYPDSGGTAIVILDAADGSVISRTVAPDGMQVVEFCWLDGELYFSAVTDEGTGIYDSSFKAVLQPARATINNPFVHDGAIHFTADRNGSEELYAIREGKVCQLTSTRFGARYYHFVGDSLYYLSGSRLDYGLYRTAVSDLPVREVDYSDIRPQAMAEELKAQADSLLPAREDVQIGQVERYSKAGHLFNFHSWMPLYVNYDAVTSLSMETLSTGAGVGATVLFQNDLNTMQGFLGYSAWTPASGWRHGLHGKLSYSGWYPVIEASIDFNDSEALRWLPETSYKQFQKIREYKKIQTGVPSLKGDVRMYVPLGFSSGGWLRGVIPQIDFSLSNDSFSNGTTVYPMEKMTAALRAYVMRPVAPSCIYPRFGIGAEAGYSTVLGLNNYFYDLSYCQVYGYLPGIMRTHGISWNALFKKQDEASSKLSVNYALPFAPVDWSFLSPVAYIRNFEFIANCTWSHPFSDKGEDILSFAGTLNARLGNLLWIPYDTRIGIIVSYTPGISKGPECGLSFSIDM